MAALGVGGLDYASLGCAVSAVNVLRRVVGLSAGVVGGRGPVPAAPGVRVCGGGRGHGHVEASGGGQLCTRISVAPSFPVVFARSPPWRVPVVASTLDHSLPRARSSCLSLSLSLPLVHCLSLSLSL